MKDMKRFLTTAGALALTLSSLSVLGAEIADCVEEGSTWYGKSGADSFRSCFVRQSGRDNDVLLVEGGLTGPTTWTRICPDTKSAGAGFCQEFRNRRDNRGSAAVLLVHTPDYYTMSVRQFNQVPDLADCLDGDLCYRQIAVTNIPPGPVEPVEVILPDNIDELMANYFNGGSDGGEPPAPETTPHAKPDRGRKPVPEPGTGDPEPGGPPICEPSIALPDPSDILIGTTKTAWNGCADIPVVGTKPLEFNIHCHSVFNTPDPSGGPVFGPGTGFGIECHDGHPNDVDDVLVRRRF